MSVFKCKMCGGTLDINNNVTIGTCEYCGTKQTLPRLDSDKRANLYDRANHFRRNNEFDKAMGIYEQILNDDGADAEAYWCLVLCRYGIEYVVDPATGKRVPTVNRAQFTSVFDDDNYKSALRYADEYQKNLYEAEAKVINDIQKGILAISQKEAPFDVFICYKETDNNGRRTPDSVLANDLYHQLVQEGFKVFFSRITLEDKLGTAYEPYIFAALNSSKVMVVLGTKQEYFNAVWVKNEWSRFLALIKGGAKKMLIPAYRDMDPYDLPEAFSHLQAQDMAKLGFMQDLIRGIKKIAQTEAPTQTLVKETVVTGGGVSTAPLLKRAFMFLEDGDWNSANEYCEKVLDQDPENAQAYVGKLMAELKVKKQEALKDCAKPFDNSNNYQKAVRFADEKLKTALAGYIEHIKTRNENARLDGIYTRAKNAMSAANTESAYKDAAQLFESVSEYQDSAALAQSCYEKAEADRLEKERLAEIARKEAEKRAKRNKKIAIITTSIICAIIAFIIILNTVIIPNGKYNDALALMDAGNYTEAISAFEALDGHKDSTTKITECKTAILDGKYNDAVALMDAGKYSEAKSAFEALDGYKDSATKITECNTAILDGKYSDAIALMDAGKYSEAKSAFEALDGYKDSADQIGDCEDKIYTAAMEVKYNEALVLKEAGKYEEAIAAFQALGDYKDSKEKASAIRKEHFDGIIKNAAVGDTITFGSYEQDNDTSNGKEDIEWRVLEIKDGKALIISKYALDSRSYNEENEYVTWETCTLRTWLNDEFYNDTFSSSERGKIAITEVVTHDNLDYDIDGGNNTQDKVFLLSVDEVDKYFFTANDRRCVPTAYAKAQGVYTSSSYTTAEGEATCWWWLRSPGGDQSHASYVRTGGDVYYSGSDADISDGAVRPALWINLEP